MWKSQTDNPKPGECLKVFTAVNILFQNIFLNFKPNLEKWYDIVQCSVDSNHITKWIKIHQVWGSSFMMSTRTRDNGFQKTKPNWCVCVGGLKTYMHGRPHSKEVIHIYIHTLFKDNFLCLSFYKLQNLLQTS